jgi:membrane-associated phospholipid phosphatase
MSDSLTNIPLNIARTMPYTLYQFGILSSLVTQNWIGVYFSGGLFLFGDVLNGLVLKPIFKSLGPHVESFKRPSGVGIGDGCGIYSQCSNLKQTWGMPSGHAQMMAIFATFWIAYLVNNFEMTPGVIVSIIIILLISLLVIWSRLYIKCHNLLQVTVGTSLGIPLGYLLFYIYTVIR